MTTNYIFLFTTIVNLLFAAYTIFKTNVYRLELHDTYVKIFIFKLGKRPKLEEIFYQELNITYLYWLSGRGIRQKKLRFYRNDSLVAIIEPGLTGWTHNTMEKIVDNFKIINVSVSEE